LSESTEQQALFQWSEYNKAKYPELELLFHVPNGGKRNVIEAARLKREGVRAGVPDLILPVARGNYHGLFIEMKANKGKATQKQNEWIEKLQAQGYLAVVCNGWEEAKALLQNYLHKQNKSEFKGQNNWD
jgi:hypothetical protein